MPSILALDTSAGACSVALRVNGTILSEISFAQRQHTLHILPMVDRLLTKSGLNINELDAIAFGCGPGSFTGLRIACGVTQGLAYAANLPVVPVSSLAAMAHQAFIDSPEQQACLACFDARMNQVYAGVYLNNTSLSLVGDEQVIEPEQLALPSEVTQCVAVGSGMAMLDRMPAVLQQAIVHADARAEVLASSILCLAEIDFKRGKCLRASQVEPKYLRQEISWKKTSEQ